MSGHCYVLDESIEGVAILAVDRQSMKLSFELLKAVVYASLARAWKHIKPGLYFVML